jgi:hypothetical protein
MGRRKNKTGASGSGYEYGSNGGSELYSSKKGTRSAKRGTFTELDDDKDEDDTHSEVQLQPMKPTHVTISAHQESRDNAKSIATSQTIAVERRWEVTSE